MNERIYADVKCAWPDGGESTGDVDKRMRLALDDLLLENHAHMCIVGHGRSNRVLLASLLYGDPLQHRHIEQGNTCISVLDVNRDGKWMLHLMNHVEHTKKWEYNSTTEVLASSHSNLVYIRLPIPTSTVLVHYSNVYELHSTVLEYL